MAHDNRYQPLAEAEVSDISTLVKAEHQAISNQTYILLTVS